LLAVADAQGCWSQDWWPFLFVGVWWL
jgi:hypothetical protein